MTTPAETTLKNLYEEEGELQMEYEVLRSLLTQTELKISIKKSEIEKIKERLGKKNLVKV